MAGTDHRLVEYIYQDQWIPFHVCAFRLLNVHTTVRIPAAAAGIRELLQAAFCVKIPYQKGFDSICGKSAEGETLTGKNILAEGMVETKIQYVSTRENCRIEAAFFELPFLTDLVIPAKTTGLSGYRLTGYVQQAFTRAMSERQVYLDCVLYVAAEPGRSVQVMQNRQEGRV